MHSWNVCHGHSCSLFRKLVMIITLNPVVLFIASLQFSKLAGEGLVCYGQWLQMLNPLRLWGNDGNRYEKSCIWNIIISIINRLHLEIYVEPVWCDFECNYFKCFRLCILLMGCISSGFDVELNEQITTTITISTANRIAIIIDVCGIESNSMEIFWFKYQFNNFFFWLFHFYENDPISIYSVRNHLI